MSCMSFNVCMELRGAASSSESDSTNALTGALAAGALDLAGGLAGASLDLAGALAGLISGGAILENACLHISRI